VTGDSVSSENRTLIQNFWAAMNTNAWAAAAEFFTVDFVLDWEQSGERIRGRDNFVAVNTNYPANGRWVFTINQIIADNAGGVSDVSVTDSVRNDRVITWFQIHAAKISYIKEFWVEPFEAAGWRAQWVEKIAS
jgi:hypothetical protein